MVVHPSIGHWDNTLVNALVYKFKSLPLRSYEDIEKPGIVHRIDKDTSGLILIAKTELAMQELNKQFFKHEVKRSYLAIIWGDISSDEGKITNYISRDPKNRLARIATGEKNNGKLAISNYKVIQRFYCANLIECKLETGRTHQIRAQFKNLGHSIIGDKLYKGNIIPPYIKWNREWKKKYERYLSIMKRQALHAKSLGFMHPRNKKEIYLESKIPEDFSQLLKELEQDNLDIEKNYEN